jgi:uncharacterized protein
MTWYAWGRTRTFPPAPPAEARLFRTDPTTQVLAHCYWQPDRTASPTLVLLHGLEGSSHAHYMIGMALKAFGRGFNVVRLNMRNCGGTEHLCDGLYHAGLTHDPRAVLAELAERDGLTSFAVAGYSLGGNVTLRLAGECGAHPPAGLKACCAVSPSCDLSACIDLLERPSNRLYEWHFVAGLKQRIRRKAALFPHLYDTRPLRGLWSLRRFDDIYTGPANGYRDAADYYQRASAIRVAGEICVPTLIITAADDPFIAVNPFSDPVLANNPAVTTIITPHGGHCGFVARPSEGDDGYWAESAVVEFVRQAAASSQ